MTGINCLLVGGDWHMSAAFKVLSRISCIVFVFSICGCLRIGKPFNPKIETTYSIDDPQFARSISSLLGAPLLPGNHVEELSNGHEIFPAMLKAIGNAHETINMETFIYWKGD